MYFSGANHHYHFDNSGWFVKNETTLFVCFRNLIFSKAKLLTLYVKSKHMEDIKGSETRFKQIDR